MADISKIVLPDGSEYNIKDATARGLVVANPTLAGTESDLTGLQVNGTKYKVPSGGGGGGGTPYDSNPAMDGTASPGSSNDYARGDHVHPTDTTRQAKITASGVLIGNGSGGVTAKTLDTTSLTNDNNHVPTSGVVKSALNFVPETSNAGFHNSIYRGKYLGSSVTAAQYAAISAGTFDDLFIGDYWTIPVTISGTTKSVNWRIAVFDYWLHKGQTECTTHHVVIVPDTALYNATMNDSNTIEGGYVGSKMYTTNLGKAKTAINGAFGSSHILSHSDIFVNAVTNNAATGWAWHDSTVELMSEVMVYGVRAWSAEMLNGFSVGIDNTQLALFALDPSKIAVYGTIVFLRDITRNNAWCTIGATGPANIQAPANSSGVRPCFGIKA